MTSETKDDLIARLEPVAWVSKDGLALAAAGPFSTTLAPITTGKLTEPLYSASTIASLTEQVEGLKTHVEMLQDKLDPDHTCACGFEAPEHVCLAHSPHLAAMTARAEAAEAQVEGLTRERDEARARLFPYADDKQISGMSWNGFYLIGNDKSIKELRRIENDAAQIEVYRAAFDERIATAEAEVARLRAENEKMREALKPSSETKVAYMGEFFVPLPDIAEDGEECMRTINVPWTTIKQIMAAIRARASLSNTSEGGKDD